MARRRNEIFAHNNKYEGNIFKKNGGGGWQRERARRRASDRSGCMSF